jgi:transposase
MDIQSAYREVGTYRAAAAICATTPKTVKRVIERANANPGSSPETAHNYDPVRELVAARVEKTDARISAKRLMAAAVLAGYQGSPRNFRRLVAQEKLAWRTEHHRGRRPGVWEPGDVLAIDWGAIGRLHVFCAVLAFSRVRFVCFADNERQETTLSALVRCFEFLGGVPKTVLADRMGCLKGGVVANVVIPSPDYLRLASHFGFSPDFCEAADPQSKGLVENLVGYVKSDLIIPEELTASDLEVANDKGLSWCLEVNAAMHSEISAVPAERLESERALLGTLPSLRPAMGKVIWRKVDSLSCVRFGSARYSVPVHLIRRGVQLRVGNGLIEIVHGDQVVASHDLVAPGETSICDDHYGGPRPKPARAVRPKTASEKAFCALGEPAQAFIKGAAAAGITGLRGDLDELLSLQRAYGTDTLVAALERACAFRRFRARDVASILAAGRGVMRPSRRGEALVVELPVVATRSLSDYAMGNER